MKKITLRLDEETYRKLRIKLLGEDQTVQGWFEEQVKNYLKEGKEDD